MLCIECCNYRHTFLTPDEGDAEEPVLADGHQEPQGCEGAVGFGQRAETAEQSGADDAEHEGCDAAVPEADQQKHAIRESIASCHIVSALAGPRGI